MKYKFVLPARFIVGTVGQPGERAFFIQVRSANQLLSVALEKAQVQAVIARLEIMIAELRKTQPLIPVEKFPNDDSPLESPVDPEFTVGAISLAFDDQNQLISLALYELEDDEVDSEGEVVEIEITLGMASAFVVRSKAVVNAGRLPCPFCGIPIDPRGHLCPRANGYRR